MFYIILVVSIIFIFFVSAGLYTAYNVARNEMKPDYDILQYKYSSHEPEYEKDVQKWIRKLDLNYITIKSPYLYNLNALIIENNNRSKWVILLHGVTSNHKTMLPMAYMYKELGYNTLLWDSRNHGKSEGGNITYGYYEKYDLRAAVDFLRGKYGSSIKIGLHGISMGASILLSYASSVRDDCSYYAADCPYSNMYQQVFDVTKKTLPVPNFIIKSLMQFAKFFIRLIFKFRLDKIDIVGNIHKVENPIFFVSCKDDGYINPDMTQELYDKCSSSIKKLVWFQEGGHGGAFPKNREKYINEIKNFLIEIKF